MTEFETPDVNWEWYPLFLSRVVYAATTAGIACGFLMSPIDYLMYDVLGFQRLVDVSPPVAGVIGAIAFGALSLYFIRDGRRYEDRFFSQ